MTHRPLARNIPLFIAFRVFFNARWYYPVLAVLFLDFGLTIEQYALLNVAWAAAIVGLEVPSGALADRLGRKRLVVFAAVLMVVEMTVFAFAPRGNATLLFVLFFINRILSGAAEASASGADEALAYDSLVAEGRAEQWPQVLERVMRWQSIGFFVAMMLGAAVYDASFVQRAIDLAGLPWKMTHEITMRFPLYLTLGNAVLALLVTLNLREPSTSQVAAVETEGAPAGAAWRTTLAAGRWILQTPLALGVILAGLCFDSIVRLFMTMTSNYYRLIALPDAAFGLIGSGFAVFGFFVPALAKRLVGRGTKRGNFAIVAALVLIALAGIARLWPIYGLIWLVPLGVAMSLTQFFVSHYLNEVVTDSRQRATVLSFRGLAFNLAYGGVGLLFAGLSRGLSAHMPAAAVFGQALGWLPWYFVATVALLAVAWRRLKL
ncbi:MAG: MFS transporter [Chthoniobacteraceae bacterium]